MKIDASENLNDANDITNLLLLFESGELDAEKERQLREWISTNEFARRYLQELEDVKDAIIDSTPGDPKSSEPELNFVSAAIDQTSIQNQMISDSLTTNEWNSNYSTLPPEPIIQSRKPKSARFNEQLLVALTGGVALVLGAVAVYSVTKPGALDVGITPRNQVLAKNEQTSSVGSEAKVSNKGKKSATASPKRKRVTIRSKLLSRIQLSRAKMKTFRKRIRRPS